MAVAQEGLGFGGEDDAIVSKGIPEGLLAETVTGKEEVAGVGVVDGEGEHALEMVEHGLAVAGVEVEQHLGIAGRTKRRAVDSELAAEFRVVVDLAIEGDGKRRVGQAHRLARAGRVDDGQSLKADGAAAVRGDKGGGLVRAAVSERVSHPSGAGRIDLPGCE